MSDLPKAMGANSHTYQQCKRVPLVSHPYQSLRLSFSFLPLSCLLTSPLDTSHPDWDSVTGQGPGEADAEMKICAGS